MADPNPNPTWTTVHRRCRRDAQPTYLPVPSEAPIPNRYIPYSSKPSYAQALLCPPASLSIASASSSHPPKKPPLPQNQVYQPVKNTDPYHFPVTKKPQKYCISPHSPTRLRLPPSPLLPEWDGRCFNCLRLGHTRAVCRNNKKCGSCWLDGHTASMCPTNSQTGQKPTTPPQQNTRTPSLPTCEPHFEDLSDKGCPSSPLPVAGDRPAKISVYVDRDESYYGELTKLKQAVVIEPINQDQSLPLQHITTICPQASLSHLPGGRILLVLPANISHDEFLSAVPRQTWDMGIRFRTWSPLIDSTLATPTYNVWLDISGIPPDLFREREVIRAVSTFGIYLGSIRQELAEYLTWSVAIAAMDLALIPRYIEFIVADIKRVAMVSVRSWVQGEVYLPTDMPNPSIVLCQPPQQPRQTTVDNDDPNKRQRTNSTSISINVGDLRELLKDVDLQTLPPDIAAALTVVHQAEQQQSQPPAGLSPHPASHPS